MSEGDPDRKIRIDKDGMKDGIGGRVEHGNGSKRGIIEEKDNIEAELTFDDALGLKKATIALVNLQEEIDDLDDLGEVEDIEEDLGESFEDEEQE